MIDLAVTLPIRSDPAIRLRSLPAQRRRCLNMGPQVISSVIYGKILKMDENGAILHGFLMDLGGCILSDKSHMAAKMVEMELGSGR